jgi:hypothetical protein
MTTTAEQHAAEIEPVIAGAIRLLSDKPGITVADLAAAVVPPREADPAVPPADFPKLPKSIVLTETLKEALRKLPKIFGSVDIATRRTLTQDERTRLTEEAEVVRQLVTALTARKEAISEIMRVHMDVQAEIDHYAASRLAVAPGARYAALATPRDQNGHYLLATSGNPHQVQVGARAWSQEYSSGSAEPKGAELEALHAAGAITRPEYLALTREVRNLDTEKMSAFIRRNPARGLEILRKITRRSDPKSAMYLREVK